MIKQIVIPSQNSKGSLTIAGVGYLTAEFQYREDFGIAFKLSTDDFDTDFVKIQHNDNLFKQYSDFTQAYGRFFVVEKASQSQDIADDNFINDTVKLYWSDELE